MEFIDLKAQYSSIKDDVLKRIEAVLEHGHYILGPEVNELEQRLASYVNRKHCISCANGTDALLMALMALGVGRGDAVFTTTFTFIATAEVIALLGATPVFVDINERSFNIDPENLAEQIAKIKSESKLTPKAIIAVDLFGLPAEYDQIEKIAEENGLFLVEDGAQGFGGVYNGKRACSFGDISATSFFPAKPLGCYGDGGAVFTDDDILAEKLRSIRVHGKGTDKYDNIRLGLNGRLDTLQAAVLLSKIEIFDNELSRKQKVAEYYNDNLDNSLVKPEIPGNAKSAWAQYSLCSSKRDRIMGALKQKKIPSMVYYPKPLHLQTAFSFLGHKEGDFPVAERVSRIIFSLPMHAYLTEEELGRICEGVNTTD